MDIMYDAIDSVDVRSVFYAFDVFLIKNALVKLYSLFCQRFLLFLMQLKYTCMLFVEKDGAE